MPSSSGTELAVRHAARRIGLQAAGLFAIVVLALTALAVLITSHQQNVANSQLVADTAEQADDVIDPPPHCWLVLRDNAGTITATPGLPAGLPYLTTGDYDLRLPTGHFLVHTRTRGRAVLQVVLDLGPSDARQRALLIELGLTAAAGLLLAGAVGVLLARRVLTPLRRTMDLQRQFVADASHELRGPLTLLHTRAQMLEQELAGAPEGVRAEAAGVVRDSDRFAELVDDLLLAAAPLPTSERTDISLGPLAADAVASARPHAHARGIELELAEPDAPVVAPGWAPALHRALVALIDNAIEHTPPGGRITVTIRQAGRRAELVVRDTGSGFDQVEVARLTDRFHSGGRGHGRRRYGLGLALVTDVTDRHGGQLRAVSVPGQGAEFTVSIPAKRG